MPISNHQEKPPVRDCVLRGCLRLASGIVALGVFAHPVFASSTGKLEVRGVRINQTVYAASGAPILIGNALHRTQREGVSACHQTFSMHALLHNAGPSLMPVERLPLLAFTVTPGGPSGQQEIRLPLPNSADAEVAFGRITLPVGTFTLQLAFQRTTAVPAIPDAPAASFVLAVTC